MANKQFVCACDAKNINSTDTTNVTNTTFVPKVGIHNTEFLDIFNNFSGLMEQMSKDYKSDVERLQKKYDALFAFVCVLFNDDEDENLESIFNKVKREMNRNFDNISSMSKRINNHNMSGDRNNESED